MDKEAFDNYLKERYNDQMKWYASKARFSKGRYQTMQLLIIIFSVITPVLIGFNYLTFRYISIILTVLIAIFSGALKLYKYNENWMNYRTTRENLKKEKYYYDFKISEYSLANDPEGLFVKRVEGLISGENVYWVSTQETKS